MSDEAALHAFATRAGLSPFDVADIESPWHYRDLATALRSLRSSGVASRAAEHSSEEAIDEMHREALAPFRRSDGSYRVGATFRALFARA